MAAKKKSFSGKQISGNDAVKNGADTSNRRKTTKANVKRKNQQLQQQYFNENDFQLRLQEVLFTPEQICDNIFRNDGPPLGVEFDCVPSRGFGGSKTDCGKCHQTCPEGQRPLKRQKVCSLDLDYQNFSGRCASKKKHGIGKGLMTKNGPSMNRPGIGKGLMTKNGSGMKKQGIGKGLMTKRSSPAKKYGIGKGLMTVWKLTNPNGDLPMGIATPTPINMPTKDKRKLPRKETLASKLRKKALDKKKPSPRLQKVGIQKVGKQNLPRKGKCELAFEGERCREDFDRCALLMDDEELELRELQAGPNPLTCSHLGTTGLHGCSLCKDLLSRFPPDSVSMKLPLNVQPWNSSPELVKKLFKAFHFISTFSVIINTCSFTLDEFAQAFINKDSSLLGQVHLSLLKLLLADIDVEIHRGYFNFSSKNSKFMELLHSIEDRRCLLESWHKTLNAMTWTEILRQVLVAAGFGSKAGTRNRNAINKEVNIMAKYGLSPGTLKGELFSALLTKGNNGMKVHDLSKLSSITELNLAATSEEVEYLISSTLSSDITLFEKISASAYRLRVDASMDSESCQSDSEDFGSVDNDSEMDDGFRSGDESEVAPCSSSTKHRRKKHQEDITNNMLALYTEIDESHPGEAWLLGLMESEYSDLSIEEKLSALLALNDLLNSGSSVRREDPVAVVSSFASNLSHGTGGKIKRSVTKSNENTQIGCYSQFVLNNRDTSNTSVLDPIDSLAPLAKISKTGKAPNAVDVAKDLHSMQSIFLGSDRRYNRYWLFLGPCDGLDPGHRRIYFESSEDGHWEVIDTQEALCSLLSSLDRRGAREAFLLSSLEKRESCLCRVMSDMLNDAEIRQLTLSDRSELNTYREDSSSAVSDVDNNLCLVEMQTGLPSTNMIVLDKGRKAEKQRDNWSRTQAFDKWIWESFYSGLHAVKRGKRMSRYSFNRCVSCHDLYCRDEKHCKVCHTTFELDFDLEEKYAVHVATCRGKKDTGSFPKHKILSSQLQSLKAAIHAIESVMPEEAMSFRWAKSAHNLWVKRLRRVSNLTEFVQVVADFVSAINEDYLISDSSLDSNWVLEEILSSFPAMHQTSSALALWLVKLDALVELHLERGRCQNVQQIVSVN